MEKIYYLDLPTLIHYLDRQSALLVTELFTGVAGLAEPCTGSVRLRGGSITECVVQAKNGRRMDGLEAFRLLSSTAEWRVTLEHAGELPCPELPPMPVREYTHQGIISRPDSVPRQQRPLHPTLIERLSAKERMIVRMVLLMVNGSRSVGQIKEHLSLPAETVDRVLEDLRRMQVIE